MDLEFEIRNLPSHIGRIGCLVGMHDWRPATRSCKMGNDRSSDYNDRCSRCRKLRYEFWKTWEKYFHSDR